MKNIAVFASGAGTNAQKIIDYFKNSSLGKVSLIGSNNHLAGVVKIAAAENIPVLIFDKKEFNDSGYLHALRSECVDFIALAGFLWKIPGILIENFPGKIINIHPALLPGYGGKGMYGSAVHDAVIKAGEKQSGITIHYVDEKYDHGRIIFQATCPTDKNETVDSLAKKIHLLEHKYYPLEIEKILEKEE